MFNAQHVFVQKLLGLKPYVKEACKKVVPREVSIKEFDDAILKLEVAENQFMLGHVEDNDTNALKLTIAEIELSKLIAANKKFLGSEVLG